MRRRAFLAGAASLVVAPVFPGLPGPASLPLRLPNALPIIGRNNGLANINLAIARLKVALDSIEIGMNQHTFAVGPGPSSPPKAQNVE